MNRINLLETVLVHCTGRGSTSTVVASTGDIDTTNIKQQILDCEEEVQKYPYNVSAWISYLEIIDDIIISTKNSNNNNNHNNKSKSDKFSSSKQSSSSSSMVELELESGFILLLWIEFRDQIGRRAVQLLPRSYKLWKCVWENLLFVQKEFILQQKQFPKQQQSLVSKLNDNNNSIDTDTGNNSNSINNYDNPTTRIIQIQTMILSCFEQAVVTLSSYPRVWMVYIQWWIEQYKELALSSSSSSSSYILVPQLLSVTNFRHTIDRALESVAVLQHDKIWSVIVDWLFEYEYEPSKDSDNDDEYDDEINNDENEYKKEYNNHRIRLQKNTIVPIETSYRILRRHCMVPSLSTESSLVSTKTIVRFAQWCERYGKYGPAAIAYMSILNGGGTNRFRTSSSSTTTNNDLPMLLVDNETYYQCWTYFCELITQHSEHVQDAGIPWENIIRTAIEQQLDNSMTKTKKRSSNAPVDIVQTPININNNKLLLGMLYTQLANAWIRRGEYDLARSVYEEGIQSVCTVRDFTILYASYLQLEDNVVNAIASQALEEDEDDENDENENMTKTDVDDGNYENDWDILLQDQLNETDDYDEDDDDDEDNDGDKVHKTTSTTKTTTRQKSKKNTMMKIADMEYAIARAEHLTQRRPILLNAVRLRQDPTNVDAWIERAELYMMPQPQQQSSSTNSTNQIVTQQQQQQRQKQQAEHAAAALEEGLIAVSSNTSTPGSAATSTGKNVNHSIGPMVQRLVQIYEEVLVDTTRVTQLMERVCYEIKYNVASVEDASNCWTAWIEFVLRQEKYEDALSLSRQSVNSTMKGQSKGRPLGAGSSLSSSTKLQRNNNNNITGFYTIYLNKSLRLWDLLLDLEESLGTVQTTKDAYNQAIQSKVATIQHILNFGTFLTEHQYYEESYTAYERGIELFDYRHNAGTKLIWKTYLRSFIQRYRGSKIERTRSLFQRCLEQCPSSDCSEFFIMNGEYEEQYGLTKRALSVYRDMCQAVPDEEKYDAYRLFILKTTKYLGIVSTRDVYQEAIETLQDSKALCDMCIEFAKMESESLHQIARARAIYSYGSEQADPRRNPKYWIEWKDFEVRFGNEETFRDMLRTKRQVEASFSTINYNAAAAGTLDTVNNTRTLSNEEAIRMIAEREGVEYENNTMQTNAATPVAGFVAAAVVTAKRPTLDDVEARVAKLRKVAGGIAASRYTTNDANNEEEIELPNDDNDEEEEEDDNPNNNHHGNHHGNNSFPADTNTNENDDEINIDDIDAEIEQAAAEGEIMIQHQHQPDGFNDATKTNKQNINNGDENDIHASSIHVVHDVQTRDVPKSVFGGLVQ